MEKEKNYIPFIIAFGIIVFVVLAGLYYIGNNSTNQPQNTTASNTFYVKSEVNVRKCAAITCDSYGKYSFDSGFTLAYKSLDDLPDWVEVSFKNTSTGENIDGYISKSLFSLNQNVADNSANQTPQQQVQQVQQPQPANQIVPKATDTMADYNNCLATAKADYLGSWATACSNSYTAYMQCYQQYGDIKDYCKQTYGGWQNSSLCTLVGNTATSLNNSYEADKNRCAMVYPTKQVSNSKIDYNNCLATAKADYLGSWATACSNSYTAYMQCYQQYGDLKDYCKQTYGGWQNSSTCTLVGGSATSLNNSYEADKNRCAMMYGQ